MEELENTLEKIRKEIEQYLGKQKKQTPQNISLSVPAYDTAEVVEVLHSLLTYEVTSGKKVAQFERDFAEYVGVKHAIMVNSGSSANLLMLAAATNPLWNNRLFPGDEVLVPAVTWSTTVWPVINMGCVPVLVDAELTTLNMSVPSAEAALSPRTKAILVAHILGNAADMDRLQALAKKHNLLLLEDSCESLGTTFQGRYTGTFGLAGTYSFYFSHHLTTIEGGMVVTNDDEFADLCRCLRAHGWARDMAHREQLEAQYPEIDHHYLFVNIGYNLRPTELQAAFGLHQLPKLHGFNANRKAIAGKMRKAVEPLQGYLQLTEPTPGADHTWFGFPVLLTPEYANRRKHLMVYMESQGIQTRPIAAGNLAVQPALRHFPHRVSGPLLNAEQIRQRGVFWGNHPFLTDAHVDHVAATLRAFFQQ